MPISSPLAEHLLLDWISLRLLFVINGKKISNFLLVWVEFLFDWRLGILGSQSIGFGFPWLRQLIVELFYSTMQMELLAAIESLLQLGVLLMTFYRPVDADGANGASFPSEVIQRFAWSDSCGRWLVNVQQKKNRSKGPFLMKEAKLLCWLTHKEIVHAQIFFLMVMSRDISFHWMPREANHIASYKL